MSRTSCNHCYYRRPLASRGTQETICCYMLETGKSRGCPPESCCHWQSRDGLASGWQTLLTTIGKGGC